MVGFIILKSVGKEEIDGLQFMKLTIVSDCEQMF